MKKKIKLFSTIASLCLAVALMAFGVYAATNPEFTIGNQIVYNIQNDAKVNITRTVSKLAANDISIVGKNYSELSNWATGWTEVAYDTDADEDGGIIEEYEDRRNYDDNNLYTDPSPSFDDSMVFNFDIHDSFAFMVEITITTVNTNGVTIAITSTADTFKGNNVFDIVTDGNFAFDNTTIAPTGTTTATYTYFVVLKDPTVPQTTVTAAQNTTLSITVTAV